MAYSTIFKDHLAHPRNGGDLPNANAVGDETNPVCGDRIRLMLKLTDGRIDAVRFLAYGCPPTLVCASAVTELVHGRTIEDAAHLGRDELIDAIGGLPARKHHAASLAIETLRAALQQTGVTN